MPSTSQNVFFMSREVVFHCDFSQANIDNLETCQSCTNQLQNTLIKLSATEGNCAPFYVMTDSCKQLLISSLEPLSATENALKKLCQKISKVPEGEYFCFIFGNAISYTQQWILTQKLIHLNTGIDNSYNIRQTQKMFDEIETVYDIEHFDPSPKNKEYLGKKNRTEIKCRYCGRSLADGARFSADKSHSISASIGNKTFFTYDECDDCNLAFGKSVEQDFSQHEFVFRVLNGVPNRDNKPLYIFDDKCSLRRVKNPNSEGLGPIEIGLNPNMSPNEMLKKIIFASVKVKYHPQNVYRALVKYALAFIREDELPLFRKTIDWVRGEFDSDMLPIVNIGIREDIKPECPPSMTLFRRKIANKEIPYLIAELSYHQRTFLYIVPFCSEDADEIATEETQRVLGEEIFPTYLSRLRDFEQKDYSCSEQTVTSLGIKPLELLFKKLLKDEEFLKMMVKIQSSEGEEQKYWLDRLVYKVVGV